jgi:chromosome segregation ATPase
MTGNPRRKASLLRGLARKIRFERAELLRRRAVLCKEVSICTALIEKMEALHPAPRVHDGTRDVQSFRAERYYLHRLTSETETVRNRRRFFERELEELQEKISALSHQSRRSLEKADALAKLADDQDEERRVAQIPMQTRSGK